jgi:hypothetical protein
VKSGLKSVKIVIWIVAFLVLLAGCGSQGGVEVSPSGAGTGLYVDPAESTLLVGESVSLVCKDGQGRMVDGAEWSSSDGNVAAVAADGTVEGRERGEAVITATVGGFQANCKITVIRDVDRIMSTDENEDDDEDEDKDENEGEAEDKDRDENEGEEQGYMWRIIIEETVKGNFLGEYGGDTIPMNHTIYFEAINYNESPYEGLFEVTGSIHSYLDAKEEFDAPGEVSQWEFQSQQTFEPGSTFALDPLNSLVPLVKDENLDPLLEEMAGADFTLLSTGDNPASLSIVVKGIPYGQQEPLNMSVKCQITQTNSDIRLDTDMFGTFNGRIQRIPVQTGDEKAD